MWCDRNLLGVKFDLDKPFLLWIWYIKTTRLLSLDIEGLWSTFEALLTRKQEILHITNIESIRPMIKALIYQGWSPKLLSFHLLPSLATLGCLGQQFLNNLATKKIWFASVSYTELSSSPPPNFKTLRKRNWKESQALAPWPKVALPSPRLALPRVKETSLSENIIDYFRPTLYLRPGRLGPRVVPLLQRTILQEPSRMPIIVKILGCGEPLSNLIPIRITQKILSSFPYNLYYLVDWENKLHLSNLPRKGLVWVTHVHWRIIHLWLQYLSGFLPLVKFRKWKGALAKLTVG